MRGRILTLPSLEEAAVLVKTGIQEKSMVLLVGECRVDYEGRSASRLESGERLVVIKQDGAVLVHRPTGYAPVNWQPSTSAIEVTYRPDIGLVIHAVRDTPREYLTIVFTRVDLISVNRLVDRGEFSMYADEEVMRDIIAENPQLLEDGLEVLGVEKPVGDGRVDIYAVDKSGRHVLIELKRVTATREAAIQLYKYVEIFKREHGLIPRGILVAPSFSPSALETLLRLGLEYRYVDLRKIWELAKKKRAKRPLTLEEFTRRGHGSENP